jgi:hypothetical protein
LEVVEKLAVLVSVDDAHLVVEKAVESDVFKGAFRLDRA